jgi:hypothetical protein
MKAQPFSCYVHSGSMRREVYPTSRPYRERVPDRLLWMAYWIESRAGRQARRARRHLALVLTALLLTLHVVIRRWRTRVVAGIQALRQPVAATVTQLLPWRES